MKKKIVKVYTLHLPLQMVFEPEDDDITVKHKLINIDKLGKKQEGYLGLNIDQYCITAVFDTRRNRNNAYSDYIDQFEYVRKPFLPAIARIK